MGLNFELFLALGVSDKIEFPEPIQGIDLRQTGMRTK